MKPVIDLLYVSSEHASQTIRDEMAALGGQEGLLSREGDWMVVHADGKTIRFLLTNNTEEALKHLRDHYFNFVIVDARQPVRDGTDVSGTASSLQVIDKIHFTSDPDQRYPLSRIIAVLPDDERLAEHAFQLGKRQIGGYVVRPFEGSLFALLDSLEDYDPGKMAICLSGGGVEGFLFELGVVMALNAHLQNRSVTDAEIFCGISAGAILAAFLANSLEPEHIAEAITNRKGGRGLETLTPGVLYDPHLREYASRLWTLASSMPLRSWNDLISGLLKSVPPGFFRGDGLHEFIKRQLRRPGRTDDFRELERELYIGATDQDSSSHVVFGDGQWRDIPISLAVRASSALTPFFAPVKIRQRYFVDGQYTRTSNFHLAVERGAKLVVVIDPLVPVRVDVPGYVRGKGGVFSALQALKAVIHTRFMHSYQAAVDNYPDVNFVLFRPEGDVVRLMSGSPMKYEVRTEIISMAYRNTVSRIQRDFELLRGAFARHGLQLQRHPRLRATHHKVL